MNYKSVFSLDDILSQKINYRNKLIDVKNEQGPSDAKKSVRNYILNLINLMKEKSISELNQYFSDEFKSNKNKFEVFLPAFKSLITNATQSFSVDSATFNQKDCDYEINILISRKDVPTQSIYKISLNGCDTKELKITNIQDLGANRQKVFNIVTTEMLCTLLRKKDNTYTEIGYIQFLNKHDGIQTNGDFFGLEDYKGKSLFIHITEFGYLERDKNGDHFNPYNEFYSGGQGEKSPRSICDLGNILIDEQGKGKTNTLLPKTPLELYPGRSLTLSDINYGPAIGCGIIGITKFNIQ